MSGDRTGSERSPLVLATIDMTKKSSYLLVIVLLLGACKSRDELRRAETKIDDLERQLSTKEMQIGELQARLEIFAAVNDLDMANGAQLRIAMKSREMADVQRQADAATARLSYLQKRLEERRHLLAKGVVTKDFDEYERRVEEQKSQLYNLRDSLRTHSEELARIRSEVQRSMAGVASSEGFLSVDTLLRSFKVGTVAFNTPKSMYVGDSARVNLKLSLLRDVDDLRRQLEKKVDLQAQSIWGEKIKVHPRMRAVLTGTSGISVTSLDQLEDKEVPSDLQQWIWEVEAKKPGTQELTLTLSAIVAIDDRERPFPVQTFSKTIEVEVSPQREVQKFFVSNWQFLWGTAVAPISIIIWEFVKNLRDKKKKKQALILRP